MRNIGVLSIVIAILAPFACLGSSKTEIDAYDWPRWRGPNGNGVSAEGDWNPSALGESQRRLWKADIGTGYSNVVIKDNRLYTTGSTFEGVFLFCLDSATGKERWRYKIARSGDPQSTPLTDGTYVYALSSSGDLVCVRTRNGELVWKIHLVKDLGITKPFYDFAASPIFEGDTILLTADAAGAALDRESGKVVWLSSKPERRTAYSTGTHYSTPVVFDFNDKRIAAVSSEVSLNFVNAATGEVAWTHNWEPVRGAHATELIIFGNFAYLTRFNEGGNLLMKLGSMSPEIIWQNMNMSSDISSPVLVDGYIYGFDGGPEVGTGTLRCIDVETGDLMWESDLSGDRRLQNASLISAAGKLIILEDTGILHIAEASPASFQEISSGDVLEGEIGRRLFWTNPVLCNGKIYCRNAPGDLICIDVSY